MDAIPGMRKNPLPPAQAQVQETIVVQELVLYQCDVRVTPLPDGNGKALRFVCPNGITVTIPLSEAGVETVLQRLRGTDLTVAKASVIVPA